MEQVPQRRTEQNEIGRISAERLVGSISFQRIAEREDTVGQLWVEFFQDNLYRKYGIHIFDNILTNKKIRIGLECF